MGAKGKASTKSKSKLKIKVKARAKAKATPATWNKGKAAEKEWAGAWTSFMYFATKRKSFATYGENCYKGIATMRGQSVCAACDGKNEKVLASGFNLKNTATTAVLDSCMSFYILALQAK